MSDYAERVGLEVAETAFIAVAAALLYGASSEEVAADPFDNEPPG